MNKTNVITGLVVLFVFCVVYYINEHAFDDTGLDDAMNTYLATISDGNPSGLLDLMPEQKKFRFTSMSGKNGNVMGTGTYAKDEVATDFLQKGGLYFAIFGGDTEYRYQDRIISAPLDKWSRHRNVYRWQSGGLKSYIKWRKEGDEWKLDEVGDMVP